MLSNYKIVQCLSGHFYLSALADPTLYIEGCTLLYYTYCSNNPIYIYSFLRKMGKMGKMDNRVRTITYGSEIVRLRKTKMGRVDSLKMAKNVRRVDKKPAAIEERSMEVMKMEKTKGLLEMMDRIAELDTPSVASILLSIWVFLAALSVGMAVITFLYSPIQW